MPTVALPIFFGFGPFGSAATNWGAPRPSRQPIPIHVIFLANCRQEKRALVSSANKMKRKLGTKNKIIRNNSILFTVRRPWRQLYVWDIYHVKSSLQRFRKAAWTSIGTHWVIPPKTNGPCEQVVTTKKKTYCTRPLANNLQNQTILWSTALSKNLYEGVRPKLIPIHTYCQSMSEQSGIFCALRWKHKLFFRLFFGI